MAVGLVARAANRALQGPEKEAAQRAHNSWQRAERAAGNSIHHVEGLGVLKRYDASHPRHPAKMGPIANPGSTLAKADSTASRVGNQQSRSGRHDNAPVKQGSFLSEGRSLPKEAKTLPHSTGLPRAAAGLAGATQSATGLARLGGRDGTPPGGADLSLSWGRNIRQDWPVQTWFGLAQATPLPAIEQAASCPGTAPK